MPSLSIAANRAVTLASGGHLVGKILGKRYVLLEELEAQEAPAGTRFLAYDMNSLSRVKVVVRRDEQGELDPERFDLEDVDAGSSADKPRTPPPKPKIIPIERPPKVIERAPKVIERLPRVEDAAPPAPAPAVSPATAPTETIAPSLGDALERAFGVSDAEPPVPADATQPLRLAEMEELEQAVAQVPEPRQPGQLLVEPSRPVPGGKGRPETRRIEAAWFAIGHEMGEDEEATPPPAEEPSEVDAAQLWQQASALSKDDYQRFALDLSPPAPPPTPLTPKRPSQEGNPDKAVAGEIVPTVERDSTRYIKQEMGAVSPVERVKQSRVLRWSINTRAGTFVLGAVLGTLLTLLVSC